jgi:hypothetical protein
MPKQATNGPILLSKQERQSPDINSKNIYHKHKVDKWQPIHVPSKMGEVRVPPIEYQEIINKLVNYLKQIQSLLEVYE